MYGKDTYPAKGKIRLDADTSQKDLEYLHNECGMHDCITGSVLSKTQIERIEKKKKKAKEPTTKTEPTLKKEVKKEDKKDEDQKEEDKKS